jgi:hypothetical protein
MKPIWEVSGKTSGKPSKKKEQNEGEVPRNNLFLEFSVVMG